MSMKFLSEECFTDHLHFPFFLRVYICDMGNNFGLFLFLCNSVSDDRFKFNAKKCLETLNVTTINVESVTTNA